jgi:hypothetical protein
VSQLGSLVDLWFAVPCRGLPWLGEVLGLVEGGRTGACSGDVLGLVLGDVLGLEVLGEVLGLVVTRWSSMAIEIWRFIWSSKGI